MSCGPAPSASYTTDVFTPTLTYEVPRRGWFKYEDTPGTFLLVPPGNDLAVVNSGTCDFIGMYTAVVPATLADPDGCVFEAVPGIWSPTKMAAYHSKRPNLTTGRAVPVAIGGLNRVMIDMRTKAGSKLDECTAGAKDSSPPGEFTGVEPSSLPSTP